MWPGGGPVHAREAGEMERSDVQPLVACCDALQALTGAAGVAPDDSVRVRVWRGGSDKGPATANGASRVRDALCLCLHCGGRGIGWLKSTTARASSQSSPARVCACTIYHKPWITRRQQPSRQAYRVAYHACLSCQLETRSLHSCPPRHQSRGLFQHHRLLPGPAM